MEKGEKTLGEKILLYLRMALTLRDLDELCFLDSEYSCHSGLFVLTIRTIWKLTSFIPNFTLRESGNQNICTKILSLLVVSVVVVFS